MPAEWRYSSRLPPRPACAGRPKSKGMEYIRIRGARTHNLKNVNLDLPRHRLIVVTGLSGSGKSSLAFDTLYAEGQRRYVESLSAYARQFLQLMEKPDVDLIEGLSPAISIEQKATSHNPRSTVGTVTEIHDYLRLLYARVGDPYCPDHPEQKLAAMTISQMVDATLALPEDTKLMILAPVVVNRKGEQLDLFVELRAKGFVRVRVDGAVYEIDAVPRLAKNTKHTIEVVVDRLRVRAGHEAAARRILRDRAAQRRRPRDRGRDGQRKCGGRGSICSPRSSPARSATTRSPSSSRGSSRSTIRWARARAATGSAASASSTRSAWWRFRSSRSPRARSRAGTAATSSISRCSGSLAKHVGFDLERPFVRLPERVQQILLTGSGDEKIPFAYLSTTAARRRCASTRSRASSRISSGATARPTRRWCARSSRSTSTRSPVPNAPARGCGARRGTSRSARASDARAIFEVSEMPLRAAAAHFEAMVLDGHKQAIADRIIKEIVSRLAFLNNVGLDYLALDRSAETLSGGESQRIRLASQIGSGLTGVMYVLDEPSIGLHQRDNDRLLATLKHLRDLGNSVIVVEHDHDAICAADYIVDMGPGAGEHGGQVVAQGTPEEIRLATHSLTGQYLAGRRHIPMPSRRHRVDPGRMLTIEGARGNNLKRITLRLPVGVFVCVTGVSGSGKSTLINDTLYHAVARHLYGSTTEPAPYDDMHGHRVLRQGDQRRPEPDRPHAALESGDLHRALHADPRAVRAGQGGARARLRSGTLLVQRQGRTLRSVPGRRPHQGRDALPARHLRALRRLPRPALQPRDARHPVQGQEHPRSARDDGRAGVPVLRAGARGRAQALDAARRRAWATSRSASRRPRCRAARRSA